MSGTENAVRAFMGEPKSRGGGEPADTLSAGTALMLDLVMREGDHLALPYSYLAAARFNPSAGITLEYPDRVVTITGRRLEPLYQAVCTHTARRVVQGQDGFDDEPEGPFVQAIEVKERNT